MSTGIIQSGIQSQKQNAAQLIYNIQKSQILQSKITDLKNTIQKILDQEQAITLEVSKDDNLDAQVVSLDEMLEQQEAIEYSEYFTQANESLGYKMNADGLSYKPDIPDDRNKLFSSKETFKEELLKEINLLKTPPDVPKAIFMDISKYLIESINENGFIPNPNEVYNDYANYYKQEYGLNIQTDIVKNVHEYLKSNITPVGIFADNSIDCIAIQIERDTRPEKAIIRDISLELIQNHKDQLLNFNGSELSIEKISKLPLFNKFSNKEKNANIIIDYIRQFNPFPINNQSEIKIPIKNNTIDFKIIQDNNTFKVIPLAQPKVVINQQYFNEIKQCAPQYAQKDINLQKNINKLINQCVQSSKLIIEYILNYQKDYIITGDIQKLKPIRNKDIAQTLNVNETTVSNIIHNKICELPDGRILSIKHLTDKGITFIKNGQTYKVSESQVAKIIQDLITRDKSKTISHIKEELKNKGYIISDKRIQKIQEKFQIRK